VEGKSSDCLGARRGRVGKESHPKKGCGRGKEGDARNSEKGASLPSGTWHVEPEKKSAAGRNLVVPRLSRVF